jgi:hypothetical protein
VGHPVCTGRLIHKTAYSKYDTAWFVEWICVRNITALWDVMTHNLVDGYSFFGEGNGRHLIECETIVPFSEGEERSC